jgi:MFS family permease
VATAAQDANVDEPVGRTIEGTPWEEPRGPHLPDPLTRGAARIPRLSWVWIAMAAFVGVWHVLQWGYDPSNPRGILTTLFGIVPVIAPFLFGAALFARHRDAWWRHRILVIGVVVLSFADLAAMILALVRSVTLGLDPEADTFSMIWLFGSVVPSVVAVLGVVVIGRGLSAARLRWGYRPTLAIALIWLMGIVLAVGSVYVDVVVFGFFSLGDSDGWTWVYAVGAVFLGVSVVLAWAYLATVTVAGRSAGERPIGAWRLASIGPLAIMLGYALQIGSYSLIALTLGTTNDGDLLSSISLGVTGATAMGYLALIAAFISGLPSDDESADDLGGRATA